MKTEQIFKAEFEYPIPVFLYEIVDGKLELKEESVVCPKCGFSLEDWNSNLICPNCGLTDMRE